MMIYKQYIKELKPLLFKPFVKNGKFTKYDHHCRYRPYNTFLSKQIAKDIQFEERQRQRDEQIDLTKRKRRRRV